MVNQVGKHAKSKGPVYDIRVLKSRRRYAYVPKSLLTSDSSANQDFLLEQDVNLRDEGRPELC